MTSQRTLHEDWAYDFLCYWERHVRRCCYFRCNCKNKVAAEFVHDISTKVFELLRYIQDLQAEYDKNGIDLAIDAKSKDRIPCIERESVQDESEGAKKTKATKKQKEKLDKKCIERRERLRKAFDLLPNLQIDNEKESRELLLLRAILSTKYFTPPVEKTFLFLFIWSEHKKLHCSDRREKNGKLEILKNSPATKLSDRDNFSDLEHAISKLGESDQKLIGLLLVGYSIKDAAIVLKMDYVPCRKKVSRVYAKLRLLLVNTEIER